MALFLSLCLFGIGLVCGVVDDGTFTNFVVEHSLDEGSSWSLRGSISFKNAKNFRLADSTKLDASANFQQDSISVSEFKKLAAKGGLYYIRIRAKDYLYASVPACALINSDLSETITLHLDSNSKLISIDYLPQTFHCNPQKELTRNQFSTKIQLGFPSKGTTPIMSVILTQETPQEEEKGFFSKYWMWIVGFFVVFIITSLMNVPEEAAAK